MNDSAPVAPAGIRPDVWQAYLDAPEHMVAEILGGELHLQPRPRARHANVAGRLRRRLGAFDDPDAGEPGGWIILVEPELLLGPLDRPVVPASAPRRSSGSSSTSRDCGRCSGP